jgi:hypothetical protein
VPSWGRYRITSLGIKTTTPEASGPAYHLHIEMTKTPFSMPVTPPISGEPWSLCGVPQNSNANAQEHSVATRLGRFAVRITDSSPPSEVSSRGSPLFRGPHPFLPTTTTVKRHGSSETSARARAERRGMDNVKLPLNAIPLIRNVRMQRHGDHYHFEGIEMKRRKITHLPDKFPPALCPAGPLSWDQSPCA